MKTNTMVIGILIFMLLLIVRLLISLFSSIHSFFKFRKDFKNIGSLVYKEKLDINEKKKMSKLFIISILLINLGAITILIVSGYLFNFFTILGFIFIIEKIFSFYNIANSKKYLGIYENGIVVVNSAVFWNDLDSWEIKDEFYKIWTKTGIVIDYKKNDDSIAIENILKTNLKSEIKKV